ncbi:hypothetical protein [Kamptonema formosum]|uniref:hypothetical protein n=1 Tax=Kamptonema formosum TaxID=331992 RepID=UPI000345984E|nr:hypothetical protein [Oscillatoria sp. PCC 10802]
MTTVKSSDSNPFDDSQNLSAPEPINPPTLYNSAAKSLFQSKTFWGIVFATTAAIAPIVGSAVKEGKLTVDHTVNIVIILCGAGGAVVGRVQAKEAVYTPNWAPGPNQSDFPKISNS